MSSTVMVMADMAWAVITADTADTAWAMAVMAADTASEGRNTDNTVEALEVGFGRLHASAMSLWLWYFPFPIFTLEIVTIAHDHSTLMDDINRMAISWNHRRIVMGHRGDSMGRFNRGAIDKQTDEPFCLAHTAVTFWGGDSNQQIAQRYPPCNMKCRLLPLISAPKFRASSEQYRIHVLRRGHVHLATIFSPLKTMPYTPVWKWYMQLIIHCFQTNFPASFLRQIPINIPFLFLSVTP